METLRKSNTIRFLSFLRAFSAVSIVVYHLMFKYFFVTDWSMFPYIPLVPINNRPLVPIDGIMKLCSFDGGAFGVAIFFMITGFTAAMSLSRDHSPKYLVKRFFRIYPTYVVGFSITVCAIFLWSRARGVPLLFNREIVWKNMSLFRNFLNCPYIDNVIWTLELTVDFYLLLWLYANLLTLLKKKLRFGPVLALSVFLCLTQIACFKLRGKVFTNVNTWTNYFLGVFAIILPYLTFTLLGSVLYLHFAGEIGRGRLCLGLLLILGEFVIGNYYAYNPVIVPSYLYGAAVFLGVYYLRDSIRGGKLLDFLDGISYPLYIVHGLNGYILMSFLNLHGLNPYLSFLVAVAAAVVAAWVLHVTVDRGSAALCKALLSGGRGRGGMPPAEHKRR